MPPSSQLGVHRDRKVQFAIKREDGMPLTRSIIQYDFLRAIFDNQQAVFTDPYETLAGKSAGTKVTFRDLYVNTLINSPRSSKVLKKEMLDSPEFGTDFAMIALLANVGRINTTMAFFPEMRTALRTYHPVPALQKQEGNLQDAPRIKNALKFCRLNHEEKELPVTPKDVLMAQHKGHVPATTAVNLVFVLANNFVTIRDYFHSGIDFPDLFLECDCTSKSRAQIFLWLCYHYLEPPSQANPFSDDYSRKNPGKVPLPIPKTAEDTRGENIDTPDEIEFGEKMTEERRKFLRRQQALDIKQVDGDDAASVSGSASGAVATPTEEPAKEHVVRIRVKEPKQRALKNVDLDEKAGEPSVRARGSKETLSHKTSHQRLRPETSHQAGAGEPYPRLHAIQPAPTSASNNVVVVSGTTSGTTTRAKPTRQRRTKAQRTGALTREVRRIQPTIEYLPPAPERTMLEHAWHVVTTIDPLIDSDEENADEHVRLDYSRRLATLNRLRGKSPTPEPEVNPMGVEHANGW